MRYSILLALLAGCTTRTITLTGVVEDGPGDDAQPLAGALVTILERSGERIINAGTDDEGLLTVDVPMATDLYAVVENDDGIESSFTGTSGRAEILELPDGQFFGITEAQREQWRDLFAGCPGIDEGGLAVGQVHVYLPGVDPDDSTIVVTATATAFPVDAEMPDDEGLSGCYLNDDGTAYDPAAEWTGDSGWYAIGGIPEGAVDISIVFAITEDTSSGGVLSAWMPKDGVVARLPTFVDFPFDF